MKSMIISMLFLFQLVGAVAQDKEVSWKMGIHISGFTESYQIRQTPQSSTNFLVRNAQGGRLGLWGSYFFRENVEARLMLDATYLDRKFFSSVPIPRSERADFYGAIRPRVYYRGLFPQSRAFGVAVAPVLGGDVYLRKGNINFPPVWGSGFVGMNLQFGSRLECELGYGRELTKSYNIAFGGVEFDRFANHFSATLLFSIFDSQAVSEK